MSRNLTATNATAAASDPFIPVLFVKLEFDSGNVLVHSGLGSITWGGDTYTGVGSLGQISPINEDTELGRSTIQMTLSGIPGDMLGIVFNEYYQGNPATVFLGFLDTTTMQLQDTPFVLFKGRIDTADIAQDSTCSVTLSVESRFASWDKPLIRRFNNADQQLRYPGDKGLEFVEQMVEKSISWGQKAPA